MVDLLVGAEALARVDAADITALVGRLRGASLQLRSVAAWVKAPSALIRGWTGAGYDAFVRALDTTGARMSTVGDALGVAALALSALATVLQSLQEEVRVAGRIAQTAGPTDPGPAIASQLTEATLRFRAADVRTAGLLADALLLDLSGGSARPLGGRVSAAAASDALAHDVSTAPPPPTSPEAVALWWAGLTPAAQASAEVARPGSPRRPRRRAGSGA